MITTVLFDLDGTLLPMDQDVFTKQYFQYLIAKVAPLGYTPEKLIDTIWKGTAAMVRNDGGCTNEEAFWNYFVQVYGEESRAQIPVFEDFYRVEFQQAKNSCGFHPAAAQVIAACKQRGLHLVLATNPIFPAIATESRIRWAGLEPEDFELYTTYENSCHCKPNPEYYRDILAQTGYRAEECLMVGNDVTEDMVAEALGMKVFLLKDCMINKGNADISRYPQGSFAELLQYIENL